MKASRQRICLTSRRAYLVQGKYAPPLLSRWDDYKSSYETENIRPSAFAAKQQYVILFLSDGGQDLESFAFDKKSGWTQAAGTFWQVADALARAEAYTDFEVRGLLPRFSPIHARLGSSNIAPWSFADSNSIVISTKARSFSTSSKLHVRPRQSQEPILSTTLIPFPPASGLRL